MSRKTPRIRNNGFADVIGVALLAAALLLLVAQFSFDRNDISFLNDPLNKPAHNWIGTARRLSGVGFVSSRLAWWDTFCRCCSRRLGVAYLLNFLGYLRERLRWSLLWSAVLVISLTGLLYMMDSAGWLGKSVKPSARKARAAGWDS